MKIAIIGSRTCPIDNEKLLTKVHTIIALMQPEAILSGGAAGGDRLGEIVAERVGIPVERHPAKWETFGKSAGYRRNEEMIPRAGYVIALWDGKSPGTRHAIEIAKNRGIRGLIINI